MGYKEERISKILIVIAFVLSFTIFLSFAYLFISGKSDLLDHAIMIAKYGKEDSCETTENPTVSSDSDSLSKIENTDDDQNDPSAEIETGYDSSDETESSIGGDNEYLRILNNREYIAESYVPEGIVSPDVEQYEQQTLRLEAAEALEEMFNAADTEGIHLYFISGYRSYQEQVSLWYTYKAEYGTEIANQMDAVPGRSEHQLGLAADLGDYDNPDTALSEEFNQTPAYQWLLNNSWKYGWIERYPEGKENITGVMYSPWAFRYFGRETASEIYASGLCAEEYFEKLQ